MRPIRARRPYATMGSWSIKVAALAVVLAALYFGKPMLAPLALAVLLSLLLSPSVHFLERFIGRVAAVIVSVVFSIILVSSAGYGVGVKTVELASRLPQYKERIRRKTELLKKSTGSWVGKTVDAISEITQEFAGKKPVENSTATEGATSPVRIETVAPGISPVELTTTILAPLLAPLETALIVLIFSIYFLIQPDDLRNRLLRLAGRKKISATSHAFDEVSRKVSHFLLMQTVINLVYGALIAAGMTAMGFADGWVWGGLVAILRFVPYIGTWIAALPPFLILVATTDGWQPGYLLMLFAVMDVLFAFVIEPHVIGGGIGISPLSLLVAAVFWAWLWGPLGLLLATPLTVCLAVMGKHVAALKFLNVLLTDKAVLKSTVRFYHRLLASNRTGALKLLKTVSRNKSYCEICDDMLLPVLTLSEIDRRSGGIDQEKARTARALAVELVGESYDCASPATAGAEAAQSAKYASRLGESDLKHLPDSTVLCLPARSDVDDLAAHLFATMLTAHRIPAQKVAADSSIEEVLHYIERSKVEIICISALPPAAGLHVRSWIKRLRARYPRIPIVVGLWAQKSDPERLRRRIGCSKSDGLVSTFAAAAAHIDKQLPLLIKKHVGKAILAKTAADDSRLVASTPIERIEPTRVVN